MGTSWRCRYRQAVKACEWGHPKELAGSYGEVAESSWLMMLRMLRKAKMVLLFFGGPFIGIIGVEIDSKISI